MFWLSPHSISALPWYNKTRPTHLYKGLTVSNRVAFEQHHLSSKRFVHCWRVAGKSRRSVQQRTLWNFSRSRSSQTGAAPHDLITDNNKSLLLSYTIKNLFMQCRYLRSTVPTQKNKIYSTVPWGWSSASRVPQEERATAIWLCSQLSRIPCQRTWPEAIFLGASKRDLTGVRNSKTFISGSVHQKSRLS